jgi:hypothetical protein
MLQAPAGKPGPRHRESGQKINVCKWCECGLQESNGAACMWLPPQGCRTFGHNSHATALACLDMISHFLPLLTSPLTDSLAYIYLQGDRCSFFGLCVGSPFGERKSEMGLLHL